MPSLHLLTSDPKPFGILIVNIVTKHSLFTYHLKCPGFESPGHLVFYEMNTVRYKRLSQVYFKISYKKIKKNIAKIRVT
jgi:hypothetical protein